MAHITSPSSPFFGRERELEQLRLTVRSKRPHLLAVTGRRRVGKSRLIREFSGYFESFFEFTALAPAPGIGPKQQKEEFVRRWAEQFGLPRFASSDWGEIFSALSTQLSGTQKTLVLLDEISWMAKGDATLLAKFKVAWDLYLSRIEQLCVVVCGSVSHWIEENLLTNTGFVGRVSYHLRVEPLSLANSAKFWGGRTTRISSYEKLKILAVTGGIPRYLEEVEPADSAEDNISRLCFRPGAFLLEEFEKLFVQLLSAKASGLKRIVEELSSGSKTYAQLTQQLGKTSGGGLSSDLTVLASCGFITEEPSFSIATAQAGKFSRYRLSDNYLRFYLCYLSALKTRIETGVYTFRSFSALNRWETVLGLQFENLVLNNKLSVLQRLRLDLSSIVAHSPYIQRRTKDSSGLQIDYLIQDKFNTLYVCEIKCSKGIIPSSVIAELDAKLKHLKRPTGFSVRPVLIYAGTLSEEVRDCGYFDRIVSLDELMAPHQTH